MNKRKLLRIVNENDKQYTIISNDSNNILSEDERLAAIQAKAKLATKYFPVYKRRKLRKIFLKDYENYYRGISIDQLNNDYASGAIDSLFNMELEEYHYRFPNPMECGFGYNISREYLIKQKIAEYIKRSPSKFSPWHIKRISKIYETLFK